MLFRAFRYTHDLLLAVFLVGVEQAINAQQALVLLTERLHLLPVRLAVLFPPGPAFRRAVIRALCRRWLVLFFSHG